YTFNPIVNDWNLLGSSKTVGYYNHGFIYYTSGSGNKTRLWQVEFDSSGRRTHCKVLSDSTKYSHKSKGNFVERISALDGRYPINGLHTDGYWYIKGGLANINPELIEVSLSENRYFQIYM